MTVVTLFSAKFGVMQQKITGNQYRAQQAFEAAEAGLEYGLNYLDKNSATVIIDSNSDGYIDNYTSTNTPKRHHV